MHSSHRPPVHALRLARLATLLVASLVPVGLSGCSAKPVLATSQSSAQLFEGMGSHHRAVTTDSPAAQRWFDQGLVWAFAFNHDEAIRSFEEATRHDPDCAMAWWGIALCHGPHINNPAMTPERSEAAWAALERAKAVKHLGSPVERALIDALASRYAWPVPADRVPLDAAYASAMRDVSARFPQDADVATLFAESMMDLRPWDLWTQEGSPNPGTEELVAALETALRLDPKHPGANHLYIHAIEASPHPEKAMAAADTLRHLVPAAGHLVHMPSHIDVRTGRWQEASDANERAMAADRAYRARSPQQGFYRVYMAHNHHFLAFSAMMEARRDVALVAAREMVAGVPEEFIATSAPLVDPVMPIVYDVLKRFGMWDELLAEPAPNEVLPFTTAMWHLCRAVAWAAKGNLPEAQHERSLYLAACDRVPADALLYNNPAHRVLEIGKEFLDGEIAWRRGDIDAAARHLHAAAALEDQLRYMEPPEWIQPVRHALGAMLASSGRWSEAEAVYREDLVRWPENGWSLLGLSQCLEAQGRQDEAVAVKRRLATVWSRSDVAPQRSCLCVTARDLAAR